MPLTVPLVQALFGFKHSFPVVCSQKLFAVQSAVGSQGPLDGDGADARVSANRTSEASNPTFSMSDWKAKMLVAVIKHNAQANAATGKQ